jgi:aminoglycoside phosphotransferase family enzyme/predicted kinase
VAAVDVENGESQEAVFAFLADPATHGGEPVKRFDTHAASVFVAGRRALKVKRAVRFTFLDYSTLERRRQACEAELAINKPLASQIYRGVVPITQEEDGRLALSGCGSPIEWAVEMCRFDESATLDRLAQAGKIDAALADALGRTVAEAQALPAAPLPRGQSEVRPESWIKALGDYIDEHAAAFSESAGIFPSAEIDALAHASRAAYDRIGPILRERGERGLIRRIHGDLHLGNVVLLDGRPVLFDAIEFSPLIASGDLLYDVAFLLMDLAERGLDRAANIVFNRYLIETRRAEDVDALAALPLFLSMRAAIRAKVTAARIRQNAEADKQSLVASARRYFDFARRFISPPPPVLLAIGGLSGTGKTALAQTLAPEFPPAPGAVVLRSDIERKSLFGRNENDKLPAIAYDPLVTARVYAAIADKARRAVAAGHSAIVDAVFAREEERRLLVQSSRALAVPLRCLFLEADLSTRVARVGNRRHDASDADAAVARDQESYDLGTLDWPRVDASGSPQETLNRVREYLK